MGSDGGGGADEGVVLGDVEEARGNLQSLRGKVPRWKAKLGRCRELGDVPGGMAAGEEAFGGEVLPKGGIKGTKVVGGETGQWGHT